MDKWQDKKGLTYDENSFSRSKRGNLFMYWRMLIACLIVLFKSAVFQILKRGTAKYAITGVETLKKFVALKVRTT